jgi:hypothetical protein
MIAAATGLPRQGERHCRRLDQGYGPIGIPPCRLCRQCGASVVTARSAVIDGGSLLPLDGPVLGAEERRGTRLDPEDLRFQKDRPRSARVERSKRKNKWSSSLIALRAPCARRPEQPDGFSGKLLVVIKDTMSRALLHRLRSMCEVEGGGDEVICQRACGKLPTKRLPLGSYSSDSSPTSFRSASSRLKSRRAACRRPARQDCRQSSVDAVGASVSPALILE